MKDGLPEIAWKCVGDGEVAYKVFDCPFCPWHYSPGMSQDENRTKRDLMHHMEYTHSWRGLIVVGQSMRAENRELKRQIAALTKALA